MLVIKIMALVIIHYVCRCKQHTGRDDTLSTLILRRLHLFAHSVSLTFFSPVLFTLLKWLVSRFFLVTSRHFLPLLPLMTWSLMKSVVILTCLGVVPALRTTDACALRAPTHFLSSLRKRCVVDVRTRRPIRRCVQVVAEVVARPAVQLVVNQENDARTPVTPVVTCRTTTKENGTKKKKEI